MYCIVQFPSEDSVYYALHYLCHESMIDKWPDAVKYKFKLNQSLILHGLSDEKRAQLEFDLDLNNTSPELFGDNQQGKHTLPSSLNGVPVVKLLWESFVVAGRVIAMTVTAPVGELEIRLNFTPDGHVLMLWSNLCFFPANEILQMWEKLIHSEENGVLFPLKNATPILAHSDSGTTKSIGISFDSPNSVTPAVLLREGRTPNVVA